MIVWASFDVETDGPCPLTNSLLALGCVLFTDEGKEIDRFQGYMKPLPDRQPNTDTMTNFWSRFPEVYKEITKNAVFPVRVMSQFHQFLESYVSHKDDLRFVASPSCFDWMFLKCYYEQFKQTTWRDIGYYCWDIMSMERVAWLQDGKEEIELMEESFKKEFPETHFPVEDAFRQGEYFFCLRSYFKDKCNRLKDIAELNSEYLDVIENLNKHAKSM